MTKKSIYNRDPLYLSEITKDIVIPQPYYAQYPGTHCAFFGVAGMVPLVKNSCALLIGPEICLFNAKLTISLRALSSDPRPDNLLLLPISHDDIVFGSEKKVRKAILEVDNEYNPEILFVVTTCTQEIIGEDIDSVVADIQHETKARLLVIHTENFTCQDLVPGIENTYLALGRLMEHQPVKEGTVNILSLRIPKGRDTELVNLIESRGIAVNSIIPSYCTPTEIAKAPAAQMNIVLEHHALPLAQKMKEEFGTDFIYCERPYALESVAKWYQRIASVLDINISEDINQLHIKAEEKMASLKEKMNGKTYALGVIHGRVFDLALLLSDLGMMPVLFCIDRLYPDDYSDIKRLLDLGFDARVINGRNSLHMMENLTELKPDFFIGFYNDTEELSGLQIMERNLLFSQFKLGYACIEEVLSLLDISPNGYKILCYKEGYVRGFRGG